MKYEKEILEAYERVGFSPRGKQVGYINQIVTAYIDEGIKNVVLSAPTGTGKSIIGVIVAEVVHKIKHGAQNEHASFLLTATNALTDQYHESLGDGGNDPNFVLIKGASNYECDAMSQPGEQAFADTCGYMAFKKAGLESVTNRCDARCEYRISRKARLMARHLVTNYSYFFVDRMYAPNPLAPRTITVFDEAHLLNDLFVEHAAIYLTDKRLTTTIDEVAEQIGLNNNDVFRDLKLIRKGLEGGMITEENHMQFLEVLMSCYYQISNAAQTEADKNVRNHKAFTKFSRLAAKYVGLAQKIEDLKEYQYPAVFEYKEKDIAKGQNEHEVSIKPIFVGEMFECLEAAEFNLLMSATITNEMVKKTLVMSGDTKYIRLDPEFPTENKRVVFYKPQTLNYTSMKSPDTIKKLCANVWQIADYHTKLNERGIILCPSFAVVESIVGSLRNMGFTPRIFEHRRGEKLADVIEAFKRYPVNLPAIVITPSGYEGVDLPGDLSRFQILVKCPYASLGDKRIKLIAEQYPTIYQLNALQKIVQGAGRSVRSPEDWAITYCLDTAIQRMWNSGINEWKNEFQSSSSSILGRPNHDD